MTNQVLQKDQVFQKDLGDLMYLGWKIFLVCGLFAIPICLFQLEPAGSILRICVLSMLLSVSGGFTLKRLITRSAYRPGLFKTFSYILFLGFLILCMCFVFV